MLKIISLLIGLLILVDVKAEVSHHKLRHKVIMTAYNGPTNTTYSGTRARRGVCAVKNFKKFPIGSKIKIIRVLPITSRGGNIIRPNKYAKALVGRSFRVEDKIGHGSQLDIWVKSEEYASKIGRFPVIIEVQRKESHKK